MLLLILADGHQVGIVQDDIRRHENWVGEQPRVYVRKVLAFVLETVRVSQHREGRKAIEYPRKLRYHRHPALAVEYVLFGVEAAGKPGSCGVQGVLAQQHNIMHCGEAVEVGDEKEGGFL